MEGTFSVYEFNPALLLDHLITEMQLSDDFELAQALEVHTALLNKIRKREQTVGPALLIRINDTTGISIDMLRRAMKDRRRRTRMSSVEGTRPAGPRIRNAWDKFAVQRRKQLKCQ